MNAHPRRCRSGGRSPTACSTRAWACPTSAPSARRAGRRWPTARGTLATSGWSCRCSTLATSRTRCRSCRCGGGPRRASKAWAAGRGCAPAGHRQQRLGQPGTCSRPRPVLQALPKWPRHLQRRERGHYATLKAPSRCRSMSLFAHRATGVACYSSFATACTAGHLQVLLQGAAAGGGAAAHAAVRALGASARCGAAVQGRSFAAAQAALHVR